MVVASCRASKRLVRQRVTVTGCDVGHAEQRFVPGREVGTVIQQRRSALRYLRPEARASRAPSTMAAAVTRSLGTLYDSFGSLMRLPDFFKCERGIDLVHGPTRGASAVC